MKGLTQLRRLPIKYQIIIPFSLITLLLVLGMSRGYYQITRNAYLRHLNDQIRSTLELIAAGFDSHYLEYLSDGGDHNHPAIRYYRDKFNRQSRILSFAGIFLFDDSLRVILKTDSLFLLTSDEPVILLNQSEILSLQIGMSVVSEPIKARDNRWYMWGFTRLSERYWLGIQEGAQRLDDIEKIPSMALGIAGLAVLFVGLAGWITATLIVNPIHALIGLSRDLGMGRFHTPLPVHPHGEMAILAETMETMRRDIVRHHQEKEEMLAQIAHEIRNPLGGIELLAGLQREELIRNRHDPIYINRILQEIAGLKTLITSYLDYSKPIPPQPEWLNLRDRIGEIRDLIRQSLSDKQVTLDETEIHPHLEVWFDPGHLHRIILNLLVNSLSVVPPQSRIQLAALPGPPARFILTDSGPGIPEAYHARIFEPFFSTRKDGTGLGLPICRKLCRENHASIHLDPAFREGARMVVSFKTGLSRITPQPEKPS